MVDLPVPNKSQVGDRTEAQADDAGDKERNTVKAYSIDHGYIPGLIGRIVDLHAVYYQREWGFGLFFEAKVAKELAAFMEHYDDNRDCIWHVCDSDGFQGVIAIDGTHAEEKGAHLRWFVVADTFRGKGLGNRLMAKALRFCRQRRYPGIYLWTFAGLDAARHLYEKHTFELAEERIGSMWGSRVVEQRFVAHL